MRQITPPVHGRMWAVAYCEATCTYTAALFSAIHHKERFFIVGYNVIDVYANGGQRPSAITEAVRKAIYSGAATGQAPRGIFACSVLFIECTCFSCEAVRRSFSDNFISDIASFDLSGSPYVLSSGYRFPSKE